MLTNTKILSKHTSNCCYFTTYFDCFSSFVFNGKEKDYESDFHYYGSRYYASELSIWLSTDPMSDKYPSISSYTYCNNNPVILIDPNGEEVIPKDKESFEAITNTLREEDRNYVVLDDQGRINKAILNSHKSESLNYLNLKELVNSDLLINVSSAENHDFMDENSNMHSQNMPYFEGFGPDVNAIGTYDLYTGEEGVTGITLLPTDNVSKINSWDKDIHIILNKKLSKVGMAEAYSHEANGHALMYVRKRDRALSGHNAVNMKETNRDLMNMIIESKKETIHNLNVIQE